jgi:hypothetical protein
MLTQTATDSPVSAPVITESGSIAKMDSYVLHDIMLTSPPHHTPVALTVATSPVATPAPPNTLASVGETTTSPTAAIVPVFSEAFWDFYVTKLSASLEPASFGGALASAMSPLASMAASPKKPRAAISEMRSPGSMRECTAKQTTDAAVQEPHASTTTFTAGPPPEPVLDQRESHSPTSPWPLGSLSTTAQAPAVDTAPAASPRGVYYPFETTTEMVLWDCDVSARHGDTHLPGGPTQWLRMQQQRLPRTFEHTQALGRREYKAVVRGDAPTAPTTYHSDAFSMGGLQWLLQFGRHPVAKSAGTDSSSDSDSNGDSGRTHNGAQRRPFLVQRVPPKFHAPCHDLSPAGAEEASAEKESYYYFYLVCLSAHQQTVEVLCDFRCLAVGLAPLGAPPGLRLLFKPRKTNTINGQRHRNTHGVERFMSESNVRQYAAGTADGDSGALQRADSLTLSVTLTVQREKKTGQIRDAPSGHTA